MTFRFLEAVSMSKHVLTWAGYALAACGLLSTVSAAPFPVGSEAQSLIQRVLNATDAADPDAWIGYIYDGSDAQSAPSWIGKLG